MKYMGSKRAMLRFGLGDALDAAAQGRNRLLDVFTGSAAVAHHVAQKYDISVVASDLQKYSVDLARAILTRTTTFDVDDSVKNWFGRAKALLVEQSISTKAEALQERLRDLSPEDAASTARDICMAAQSGSICAAYGGYYYSPLQALWFDALRSTLPEDDPGRCIALGALIQAASRCAASPGHTAQPFKANATAGPYMLEAWQRSVLENTRSYAKEFGARHSLVEGSATVADALEVSKTAREDDLVFLDPPYSAVHYSRFYHVLESISHGVAGDVSGTGRYPPREKRPSSDFSVTTRAADAFDELLKAIAERGAVALVTFPAGVASNGLSGEKVRELAERSFTVVEAKVTSRFSTLGGDTRQRAARQDAHELILTLTPR